MKGKKVLVATGARSEFGLLEPLVHEIKRSKKLDLHILACGMHFSDEFGSTYDLIKKAGFKKVSKVDVLYKKDTRESMAHYIADTVREAAKVLKKIDPDFVVVLGDRAEIIAVALATHYTNRALVHIHGGDVSKGGYDEAARHVITKLAHVHFPATKKSAKRLLAMGEDPKRITVTGGIGIDSIKKVKNPYPKKVLGKYGLSEGGPNILLVQHSVTTQVEKATEQMRETLEAVKKLGYPTLVIYPNADLGGRAMIKVIMTYVKRCKNIRSVKNIEHDDYVRLLKSCDAMIGNSSSGIIETGICKMPVVNIGIRQEGRERANNVVDAPHDRKAIARQIDHVLKNKRFRTRLRKTRNIYGDGTAAKKMVKILEGLRIDDDLLQKTYMPYA